MPESEPVQRDIAAIRTEMEQIKSMQRLIVASDEGVKSHISGFLSDRENAAEVVILLSEQSMTQDEITGRLKKSQPTVSKVLKYLKKKGLIVQYKDPNNPRRMVWVLNELEDAIDAVKIAQRIVRERAKAKD